MHSRRPATRARLSASATAAACTWMPGRTVPAGGGCATGSPIRRACSVWAPTLTPGFVMHAFAAMRPGSWSRLAPTPVTSARPTSKPRRRGLVFGARAVPRARACADHEGSACDDRCSRAIVVAVWFGVRGWRLSFLRSLEEAKRSAGIGLERQARASPRALRGPQAALLRSVATLIFASVAVRPADHGRIALYKLLLSTSMMLTQ